MTDYPTLLYTSTCESLPFHIPKARRRYPFQAEPPRKGHYREYPHPRAYKRAPQCVCHLVGGLEIFVKLLFYVLFD